MLVTEEHEEESKDKSPHYHQDHDNDDDYVDISKLNNFEDAPKVTVRKYAPTEGIEGGPISFMRTSIKITDHLIKKGGFFSSDYVLFTVLTAPTRWKVERKDNDFYTLRRLIRKEFPHLLVPPLPIKNAKMTAKVL